MSSRSISRLMTGLLIIVVIAALGAPIGLAVAGSNQRQAAGELLTNPGFEQPFVQEGSSDIFVANGWQAWYIIPDGVTYPINCPDGAPATCKPYRIPVYRNSQPQDARIPPRARSGNSQQWGIQYATYVAGVYQRVSGLTPGARLHFSAYLQGFNCDDDRGCFGPAGRYGYSYEPGDMQTRVGIDPTGGTSEFSPNVVWSGFQNPLDAFSLQEVEAVAQGNTVTVFVWSSPTFPEKHTDVYVDDASLTVVGQGPVPATAAPTAPGATQPPAGTPSPVPTLPPGTTTYTIQSGDTLFAIALRFNLTLDQLLALNPGLTRDSILQIGQVINVVGTPGATAQPTPQPTPTATVAPSPTPTPALTATITSPLTSTLVTSTPTVTPTLAIANSGLCLTAYDDKNGSATRDAGEALLPGVQFNVKDASSTTVVTYTTDGIKEPHCLGNLPDGRYTVSVTAPGDRTPTNDTQYAVSLLSGTAVNIAFGSESKPAPSQLTLTPGATPTLAATAEASGARSGGGSAPLGLLVGGAMILLAAAALAFGLSSRRK